ncbi:MAG TPA: serine/threonine-protein kinase [Labilithrix sp.]|jgi:serine/threonine-protein kinase
MPADDLVGRLLGERYRIVRRLGAGGMGTVWEAIHADLGLRVAVKTLADVDARAMERFEQEARAAAALNHPNIVEVTDFVVAKNGAPSFFVMELLEGASLSAELRRTPRFSVPRAVHVASEVLRALAAAHGAGIIHRDVKPPNVILGGGPDAHRVTLVDFGIAKVRGGLQTTAGHSFGTPAYMAPEQILDPSNVDARADLHAVGVILYEMLAGARPWNASSSAVFGEILEKEAPPLRSARPDVPEALAAIVARALEKDRERRFSDAASMGSALAPWLADLQSTGGRTERMAPLAASAPPPRLRSAVFVLAAGTVAAGAALAAARLHAQASAVVQAPPSSEPQADPLVAAESSDAPPRLVLVVTDPNDTTISLARADGVTVLGLAPQTVAAAETPVAITIERKGYRPRTLTIDATTADRLDVKLEKEPDARAATPRPRATMPSTACVRPASCPAESWDTFECRCRGL